MWPFKKKRKVVGHITAFQALKWYDAVLRGEITLEEYSKLKAKDLVPITTPIYEDEINKETL